MSVTLSPVTVTAEVAVNKASKKEKLLQSICEKGIISRTAPMNISPIKERMISV